MIAWHTCQGSSQNASVPWQSDEDPEDVGSLQVPVPQDQWLVVRASSWSFLNYVNRFDNLGHPLEETPFEVTLAGRQNLNARRGRVLYAQCGCELSSHSVPPGV